MRVRSTLLVWLVVLFPLNVMVSYGSDAQEPSLRMAVPQAFDLEPEPGAGLIGEFLSAFPGISAEALTYALSGYASLNEQQRIARKDILTIVDFSKPSTEERLFVLNLRTKQVLAKSLVAHGRNSGELYATHFSNTAESFQSSLGFYVASETYDGKHGHSLRLDGMEPGFNNKARERGVVVHGADYVSYDFIRTTGRLGRSQGCPALPMDNYREIINLIEGGSCFFIYHPSKNYLSQSPVLKQYRDSALEDALCFR